MSPHGHVEVEWKEENIGAQRQGESDHLHKEWPGEAFQKM